jgi:hypothetical protein
MSNHDASPLKAEDAAEWWTRVTNYGNSADIMRRIDDRFKLFETNCQSIAKDVVALEGHAERVDCLLEALRAEYNIRETPSKAFPEALDRIVDLLEDIREGVSGIRTVHT